MAEETNPYEVELLDVLNEVGGVMKIQYHTATITLQKELLQQLRDSGGKTDVMTCIMAGMTSNGWNIERISDYLTEADAAGAAPSVTFEAPEGEALNIKSKEENPMVD